MEYYGLRKHGSDIDMLVTEKDYQLLKERYPDKRIDIWGNLAVVLENYSFNLYVFQWIIIFMQLVRLNMRISSRPCQW